jgi:hypothetical protein
MITYKHTVVTTATFLLTECNKGSARTSLSCNVVPCPLKEYDPLVYRLDNQAVLNSTVKIYSMIHLDYKERNTYASTSHISKVPQFTSLQTLAEGSIGS